MGRIRLATPATAVVLGVLMLAALAVSPPLASASHTESTSSLISGLVFVLPFGLVGLVVAYRQPRNALGWMLLGAGLFFVLNGDASAYTVLDYRIHHGSLPLGPVTVVCQLSWAPAIVLLGLGPLLFPEGRLPPGRWRWLLWSFLGTAALWIFGALAITISAIASQDIHVTPSGDLTVIDHPTGLAASWSAAQNVFFLLLGVTLILSLARHVFGYRQATGERRLQLKWLMTGALVFAVAAFPTIALPSSASPTWRLIGDIAAAGLAAFPICIGIAILKYRLFEIDRLISRTLSYAIVTGLLLGVYVGLITLTTRLLPLSSPIGVAASTLAAAALFTPLRQRVQRIVDRRFDRAHYDAEATVAAFSAGLRDEVDLSTVQSDLLDVVYRSMQPTQASIWLRERTAAS